MTTRLGRATGPAADRQAEAAQRHRGRSTTRPPAYVAGQLKAIVGVEVRISRIEAKLKLSQNRPPTTCRGSSTGCAAGARTATAAAVEQATADAEDAQP